MSLVTTLVVLVLLFGEDAAAPADDPGTRSNSFPGLSGLNRKSSNEQPIASPLACFTQLSPRMPLFKEKCDGVHDTGSDISRDERNKIVDFVNEYRAMINNNCTLGLGVPEPASNYRKVKYSCALEVESKFECSLDLTPETFTSDEHTWRSWGHRQNPKYRQAIFQRWSPGANQLLINPELPTVKNDDDKAVFIKLFMSEDVTEIGCFVKLCYGHEYIACKTNHDNTLPNNAPLYTPGQRCNADADCTFPGYTTCDASVGLCDYMSQSERKKEAFLSSCQNVRNIYIDQKEEKCHPDGTYADISNKERSFIVHVVNQFRAQMNNYCDLGKGIVKRITNYRKVRYSCALEKDAGEEFSCWNADPAWFKSSRYTLRYVRTVQSDFRIAIFAAGAPWNQDMLIDPGNQTTEASENIRSYLRFMLSPDVTEVGCFVKVCDGYEYMACKSGQVVVAPQEKPLYTPGNRCDSDEDCWLPGYTRCDYITGLCDITPQSRHISVKKDNISKCEDIPQVYVERLTEKCSPHYDTGSDMSIKEREAIVNVANQFRALINNNCDLGLGNVKPITNYRKLKYSCGYEEDVKFECSTVDPADFKSDSYTWRRVKELETNRTRPLFLKGTPLNQDLLIQPFDNSMESSEEMKHFLRLVLDPESKEIGCFSKICNGYEYYACKNGYVITGRNSLFYTYHGKRCNADADCTLTGYGFCDVNSGLCEPF